MGYRQFISQLLIFSLQLYNDILQVLYFWWSRLWDSSKDISFFSRISWSFYKTKSSSSLIIPILNRISMHIQDTTVSICTSRLIPSRAYANRPNTKGKQTKCNRQSMQVDHPIDLPFSRSYDKIVSSQKIVIAIFCRPKQCSTKINLGHHMSGEITLKTFPELII